MNFRFRGVQNKSVTLHSNNIQKVQKKMFPSGVCACVCEREKKRCVRADFRSKRQAGKKRSSVKSELKTLTFLKLVTKLFPHKQRARIDYHL